MLSHGIANPLITGVKMAKDAMGASAKAKEAAQAASTLDQMKAKILGSHPNWEGPAY